MNNKIKNKTDRHISGFVGIAGWIGAAAFAVAVALGS